MTQYIISKDTFAWRSTSSLWVSALDAFRWERFRFDRAVIYDETDLHQDAAINALYYFRLPAAALPYRIIKVPRTSVHIVMNDKDLRPS